MSSTFTMALFKAPWVAFGITAPRFIWLASLGLFVGTLVVLVRLWWLVRREQRIYNIVISQFAALRTEPDAPTRDGMFQTTYHTLQQVFSHVAPYAPALGSAWRHFEAQLVVRRDAMGQERFWATESAEASFNDDTVIEARLDRSFFAAMPGMVTGAGLLCTFLAILIALLDVTLGENNQFRGLDTLISGLSGKFLSSIAALLAATLFVPCEKRLFHGLRRNLRQLVVSLDDLVPRLTSSRLLMAIQQDVAAQSVVLQQFRGEMATTLQHSLTTGLAPTLDRMEQAVTTLNRVFQRMETQKTESITGTLYPLIQQLERSLTTTLTGMSDRFAQALSGSAHQEFAAMVRSLGGTAQLLEGMNGQFQATQTALTDLITFARNTTADQMALGKSQIEDLTTVLRQLMAQMHDSAGLSMNRMATALAAVVHDLSTRVTEIGQQMGQTVSASAGHATEAAAMVIGKVDQWSSRSTEQLAQLLEKHQVHLVRIQDVQRTLEVTLIQFKGALTEYATVTTNLRGVATQTTAMVTAAAGAMKTIKETGDAVERVSKLAALQAERFSEANRQQEETHQRLATHLQRYQQIFQQVEHASSTLLTQIDQHLQRYTTATQQGFEHLTHSADTHFANASRRLGDTVNGLDEHLQDLTDILERLGRLGGDNGRES